MHLILEKLSAVMNHIFPGPRLKSSIGLGWQLWEAVNLGWLLPQRPLPAFSLQSLAARLFPGDLARLITHFLKPFTCGGESHIDKNNSYLTRIFIRPYWKPTDTRQYEVKGLSLKPKRQIYRDISEETSNIEARGAGNSAHPSWFLRISPKRFAIDFWNFLNDLKGSAAPL